MERKRGKLGGCIREASCCVETIGLAEEHGGMCLIPQQKDTDTDIARERERERETDRQTETETETETETGRDRERERETDSLRQVSGRRCVLFFLLVVRWPWLLSSNF